MSSAYDIKKAFPDFFESFILFSHQLPSFTSKKRDIGRDPDISPDQEHAFESPSILSTS